MEFFIRVCELAHLGDERAVILAPKLFEKYKTREHFYDIVRCGGPADEFLIDLEGHWLRMATFSLWRKGIKK